MVFTWNGDPSASTLEEVRHYTGDINTNDQLLSDAQINFELGKVGSDAILAADRCFRRILAKLALEQVDRSGAKYGATRSQKFQQYKDLYAMFKAEHQATLYPALWSEHSKDDRDAIESETDFEQPAFQVDQDKYS